MQSLRILEQENQEAAERLEAIVRNGQELLEKIQAALSDIAQAQLDMQHLTKTITEGKEWMTLGYNVIHTCIIFLVLKFYNNFCMILNYLFILEVVVISKRIK